jgi:S1-C subfamily serine protease
MHTAGILQGDVIVGVEGLEIYSFAHLMKALYMLPAGEQIHLRIVRDGGEFSVMPTLARVSELGRFPSETESPTDE